MNEYKLLLFFKQTPTFDLTYYAVIHNYQIITVAVSRRGCTKGQSHPFVSEKAY
jgi:hypothetical protein